MSTTAVDAMRRAHRQIMQQARLEQKFSAKPKAWLDWSAVLTARARAVSQYELRKEEGGPGARTRLFDAALLTWLTVVPPEVSPVRCLRRDLAAGRAKSTASAFPRAYPSLRTVGSCGGPR